MALKSQQIPSQFLAFTSPKSSRSTKSSAPWRGSGTFDVSEIAKLIPRRCEVEELFDDTTRVLGT
jgi:hypothetical protein